MSRWLRVWLSLASAAPVAVAVAAPDPVPAPPPVAVPVVIRLPRRTGPSVPIRPPPERAVFHHSELEILERVLPARPEGADPMETRCLVTVLIGKDGVPTAATAKECEPPFVAASETALLQWRWAPPHRNDLPVLAQTTVAVTFDPTKAPEASESSAPAP